MAKSMNLNMAAGLGGMLKDGHKHIEGVDDAVVRNIEAAKQLAKITATSLGPNGMNKLVINHLDKILVTSDASAILEEMEVMHPAAKMLVMASKMQEKEVGDGTNFVATFAGELLKNAEQQLRKGLHTSELVDGYKKAYVKANELLDGMCHHTVTDLRDEAAVAAAIKSCLASKQYGYEDKLSQFVAEACISTMPVAPKKAMVNVDNVRTCKLKGGSFHDSRVVRGMIVTRDTEGSIKHVKDGKVAVFSCGLEGAATEAKGTVLIKSADELMKFSKGEEALMEESIRGIAEAGVKVIISGGSVSDLAMHFVERYKMMVIKIHSKFELRRMCRAAGATAMVRLGPPTPEEMGMFSDVSVQEVGGRKVCVFRNDAEGSRIATVVLRASTDNMLNDLERAIDDGVNTIKAMCKDSRFVPGAGGTEIALAQALTKFADTCPGLDQYAIKSFATALEFMPRILAENAGHDPEKVLSNLYAAHAEGKATVGVDVENKDGTVAAADSGIMDLYATKQNALRLAADCAITVLRVDQLIMSKPAGGPKPRP